MPKQNNKEITAIEEAALRCEEVVGGDGGELSEVLRGPEVPEVPEVPELSEVPEVPEEVVVEYRLKQEKPFFPVAV